jgi:hypothetical protein
MEHGFEWTSAYYGIAGLIGTLFSLYIVDAFRWNAERFDISVKKLEPNDALMLSVVVSYFVPFFGKISDISLHYIIFIVVCGWAVFSYSSAILPSPTLRLWGYRFYKVETSNGVVFTLVSRRQIMSPGDVKSVKRISDYMLVETV